MRLSAAANITMQAKSPPSTSEVAPGLRLIDLKFQGEPGVIAAYLLEGDGELALVETGPTSTLPALLDSIAECGHDLAHLTTVAVTHIHLDHAGAAGHLLARAPNAVLYVHTLGAPHLIDPTKLIRSATRIYGNQMEPLWGEIKPVPAERIVPVGDGDIVPAAGRRLRVLYTPGHAVHHVAFQIVGDDASRLVFTGDAAGVRLQGADYVRPPTPPPDIDIELWSQSIERLLAVRPTALLLTHFGSHTRDMEGQLRSLQRRLGAWAALVRSALESRQDVAAIVDNVAREDMAEMASSGVPASLIPAYGLASPYGMSVEGLRRYVQSGG